MTFRSRGDELVRQMLICLGVGAVLVTVGLGICWFDHLLSWLGLILAALGAWTALYGFGRVWRALLCGDEMVASNGVTETYRGFRCPHCHCNLSLWHVPKDDGIDFPCPRCLRTVVSNIKAKSTDLPATLVAGPEWQAFLERQRAHDDLLLKATRLYLERKREEEPKPPADATVPTAE